MHAAGDLQTASGDHLFNEGALFGVRPEERSDVAGLVEDELELRIRPHRRQGPQGNGVTDLKGLVPSEEDFGVVVGVGYIVHGELHGQPFSRARRLHWFSADRQST